MPIRPIKSIRLPARPGLVALKAAAGLALLLTAARYPSATVLALLLAFTVLFALSVASRSVYRITWHDHRPHLASGARDERASRFAVPRHSVLGQAGSLLAQLVGYGLVMTFAWGASVALAMLAVV